VVGTPLDKVHPAKHAELQRLIYLTTFCSRRSLGRQLVPTNFPERNRIMARLAMATLIIETSDTSGSLHQAAESVQIGHPVFIAASLLDHDKLIWPKRFIGDDKPLGRVLRTTVDAIDFARDDNRNGIENGGTSAIRTLVCFSQSQQVVIQVPVPTGKIPGGRKRRGQRDLTLRVQRPVATQAELRT